MTLNWWQRHLTKQALGTKRGEAAIAFIESAAGEEALTALLSVVRAVSRRNWEEAWRALPAEFRAWVESHLAGAGLPKPSQGPPVGWG